jgi:UDP-4-amino-4,6-dideoxy-N-acetyl-beta-L-altrosamine transaminase
MIPNAKHTILEDDINSVVSVLRSNFITQGDVVSEFEQNICNYTQAKYSISVNSGTSALHLSCLALGLEHGNSLWTSPISFVASSNCALYCGADVDFVDIDPITRNISVIRLKEKLELAYTTKSLPKILVVVHYSGLSCDMEAIYSLSNKYGFFIIEDACHAIGGKYKGEPIGNCKYSSLSVFSFHPAKNITTGEGGIVTTNSSDLAEKINLLRSHGITREKSKIIGPMQGSWYYQMIDLGYNYRLTDFQSALGISQLKKLDDFVKSRNKLADYYDKHISGFQVQIPYRGGDFYSAMHLYVVRINYKKLKITRKQVFDSLVNNGIAVNVHYIPIHLQPYYKEFGFSQGDFIESEIFYKEAISLPMYPTLSNKDQEFIVKILRSLLQ